MIVYDTSSASVSVCVCDSLATDSGLAHSVSSWPFRHVGKLGCRSPGRSTVSASSLIILKRVVWAAVLLPALSPLFSEHILSTYSTILASCSYLLSVFFCLLITVSGVFVLFCFSRCLLFVFIPRLKIILEIIRIALIESLVERLLTFLCFVLSFYSLWFFFCCFKF